MTELQEKRMAGEYEIFQAISVGIIDREDLPDWAKECLCRIEQEKKRNRGGR